MKERNAKIDEFMASREMTFNLSLRTVRLRDVGYWQAFMHRNALMYVHSHAGTENVQVGITHGVAENRLEKLAGDISAPFKFLPGNELVQLIVTSP